MPACAYMLASHVKTEHISFSCLYMLAFVFTCAELLCLRLCLRRYSENQAFSFIKEVVAIRKLKRPGFLIAHLIGVRFYLAYPAAITETRVIFFTRCRRLLKLISHAVFRVKISFLGFLLNRRKEILISIRNIASV